MAWHEPGKDGYYQPKRSKTKHIIVIVAIICLCALLDFVFYY